MDLISTLPHTCLISNHTEDNESSASSFPKPEINRTGISPTPFMYSEEQEKYYKESIIINYQRYKTLFRSKLIGHILIDEKNIIRDFNKKAQEDFSLILGEEMKIGKSIKNLLDTPYYGNIFQKALQSGLNELIEFEFTDSPEGTLRFQMEISLFISPSDNKLLKCISAVKIN